MHTWTLVTELEVFSKARPPSSRRVLVPREAIQTLVAGTVPVGG